MGSVLEMRNRDSALTCYIWVNIWHSSAGFYVGETGQHFNTDLNFFGRRKGQSPFQEGARFVIFLCFCNRLNPGKSSQVPSSEIGELFAQGMSNAGSLPFVKLQEAHPQGLEHNWGGLRWSGRQKGDSYEQTWAVELALEGIVTARVYKGSPSPERPHPLSPPSASANKAHGLPPYFANKVLLQHYLHPFVYILSAAVFTLQQQCQLFATETGWLPWKYFLSDPLH